MQTDLTFITNEQGVNLKDRLAVLFSPATKLFDCLVGYFYLSGFHLLYPQLEKTEKIRILIGLKTDNQTFKLIEETKKQKEFSFLSDVEVKDKIPETLSKEFEASEDSRNIENGVKKFLEWCSSGKLEVKVYPSRNIHAKLYIMTFFEGDRDAGRVITGSSNFSKSGLEGNLEFNVELKNKNDYEYALEKFNELWKSGVEVTKEYVETIKTKSPFAPFSAYELYLKFLYEHFKTELSGSREIDDSETPKSFKKLKYQTDAVFNAKSIVEKYGGVFLSDVVGLGKTYMSALLAQQLDGKSVVVAPPALLDENNPGSWKNVFRDFGLSFKAESIGKLESLGRFLQRHDPNAEKYMNIFVDEAHRFRTDTNQTYEQLAKICRGRRVILVSATPLNNSPKDILSQIKLFQNGKNSTVPNVKNLEGFFGGLQKKLLRLDRKRDRDEYLKITKENAKEIRDKVLTHLMVRRTRTEISKYYAEDLNEQSISFPEVAAPEPLFYQFDEREDEIFLETIRRVATELNYARYRPLTYFTGDIKENEKTGQRNLAAFMMILLIKRLESSFYAFRLTLNRFIKSYENFIEAFEKGKVYVSKKDTYKIFEFMQNDELEKIEDLIDRDRATEYSAKSFNKSFIKDLKEDLEILKDIRAKWNTIERDPKWDELSEALKSDEILKREKLLFFTESKETAEYLVRKMTEDLNEKAFLFTGGSKAADRETVIDNFDANVTKPKNNFRILVTTDTLAEGVNLHRSNTVINYDLPWNPTRMIQRVGRVNRVNTGHSTIHTYNFFPTDQSNDVIKLRESAESKIQAFIEMLGADAKLLTESEELKSHDLFEKLLSKELITGEDEDEESELEYLKVIREIRDDQPELFERIKRLPKKARAVKSSDEIKKGVLTYFRKGALEKFFVAEKDKLKAEEIDFLTAVKMLKTDADENKKLPVEGDFYEFLAQNKVGFETAMQEEIEHDHISSTSKDNASKISTRLRTKEMRVFKGFTDEDEEFIKRVLQILNDGAMPKHTQKKIWQTIKDETEPLKILRVLIREIPESLFRETVADQGKQNRNPREVILSAYLQNAEARTK